MRRPVDVIALAIGLCAIPLGHALAYWSAIQPEDVDQYNAVASTRAWATPPSNQYRLFVDVFNKSDFYDSEPGGDPLFQDGTTLADTIRPTLTLLWNDRWRFQAGFIAEQTYGNSPDISSIDPWIQALWKPIPHLTVVMGDLSIPHEFLPAIYYGPNYFRLRDTETGAQLLNQWPGWRDDLFFNYYQVETPSQNEKFEFGYTHYNEWKFLNFTYQADWLHTGGDQYAHPVNTINDVAQAAGFGVKQQLPASFIVGANFWYLFSRYKVETDTPSANSTINGDGRYAQAFIRWSRLKLIYGYWRGHSYQHAVGDQYFLTDNMNQGIIQWDILVSPEFTLFGEIVGYFVGNNNLGIDHYVKPTFWIQAAWHFAIPAKGWNVGSEPVTDTERWDQGL